MPTETTQHIIFFLNIIFYLNCLKTNYCYNITSNWYLSSIYELRLSIVKISPSKSEALVGFVGEVSAKHRHTARHCCRFSKTWWLIEFSKNQVHTYWRLLLKGCLTCESLLQPQSPDITSARHKPLTVISPSRSSIHLVPNSSFQAAHTSVFLWGSVFLLESICWMWAYQSRSLFISFPPRILSDTSILRWTYSFRIFSSPVTFKHLLQWSWMLNTRVWF